MSMKLFGFQASSIDSGWDIDAFMATTTEGDYWDFTDVSTLFQDTAKTTAVASEGDLIGCAVGQYRGIEYHQGTTGAKPYWKSESGSKLGASLYSLPDTNPKWMQAGAGITARDLGNKATLAFGFYDKSQGAGQPYGSFPSIMMIGRNSGITSNRMLHYVPGQDHVGYVTNNTAPLASEVETYKDCVVYYNGTHCELVVDGTASGSPNVVSATIWNFPYLGYLNNAGAYPTPVVVQRAIYFDLSWNEMSAQDQAGLRAWLNGG